MVGADGAGADETYPTAFEQSAVHLRHRTHQQQVGITHIGRRDAAPGQAAEAAERSEELIEQGNVFVGD